MADLTTDDVAKNVNPGAPDFKGAVMFKGWFFAVGEAAATARLYTDSSFMEWLEMPSDAILHRISGSKGLNAEMSSIIWVKREATITFCRSGCAHWFQGPEAEAELEALPHRDPTDIRWPRPH